MQYRQIGRTSLHVSEIGLGCSGFWGDKRFNEESAKRIVRTAFENGVNFFDTGHNYSNFNAEPRLGRALRPIIAAGMRDKLILSTKAGSTAGYAPTVPDEDLTYTDFSPDAIERSCIDSIANLGCDYLDIFQLHGLKPETFGGELFDRLESLRDRGLVRYIGINVHFEHEMRAVLNRPDIFDMILIDCNVLQLDRFAVIEELAQSGIGVVVGTVLAQGYLVSRKIGSIRSGAFFWYLARSILKPTTRVFRRHSDDMRKALASIDEMSAAQAAFAYLLRNANIASCLFGTTDINNLLEIIDASGRKLTPASVELIERVAAKHPSLSR